MTFCLSFLLNFWRQFSEVLAACQPYSADIAVIRSNKRAAQAFFSTKYTVIELQSFLVHFSSTTCDCSTKNICNLRTVHCEGKKNVLSRPYIVSDS